MVFIGIISPKKAGTVQEKMLKINFEILHVFNVILVGLFGIFLLTNWRLTTH